MGAVGLPGKELECNWAIALISLASSEVLLKNSKKVTNTLENSEQHGMEHFGARAMNSVIIALIKSELMECISEVNLAKFSGNQPSHLIQLTLLSHQLSCI